MRRKINHLFLFYKMQNKYKNLILVILLCCSASFCFGQNANDCIRASDLINTSAKKCYGNWYVSNSDSRIQYRVRGPIETSSSTLTYNKTQKLYRWDIEFKYTGSNAICATKQEYEGNINNFSVKGCYFPGETHTDVCYTLSNKETIKINIGNIVEYSLKPNGTANAIFDKKGRAWYKVLSKDEKGNETNLKSNIGNKQNTNTTNKIPNNTYQKITSLQQISTANEEDLRQLTDDQLKDLILKWFIAGEGNYHLREYHRDNDFLYVDAKNCYKQIQIPFSYMSCPAKPINENDENYIGTSNGKGIYVDWSLETKIYGKDEYYSLRPFRDNFAGISIAKDRTGNNTKGTFLSYNSVIFNFGDPIRTAFWKESGCIGFSYENEEDMQILITLVRLLNLKQYSSNEVFEYSQGNYYTTKVDNNKKDKYLYTGKSTSNQTGNKPKTNNQSNSSPISEKKEPTSTNNIDANKAYELEVINSNNLAKTTTLSNDVLIYIAKEYDKNKDFKMALEYYEAAAIKGDTRAMYYTAKYYYEPYNTFGCKDAKSYSVKDIKKSKFWFEKGVSLDDLWCLEGLGSLYKHLNDCKKALECWEKAVAKNSYSAMNWIGDIYCYGCDSIKKDPYLAKEWWRKACKAGCYGCCDKIGLASHYGCD